MLVLIIDDDPDYGELLCEAMKLIDKTTISIEPKDVEVGFEDLSHFSFAFKKHFGYIPMFLSRK